MNSLSSVFKLYLFILEAYVDAVEELYHSHFANDMKSYQGIILRRILISLKTLNQMLVVSNDPISAYSLFRTIVDSICAYCFIYENDNNEEVKFRHYLYMLDGCSKFVSAFPFTINNNELIEGKEREKINNELDQEETDLNLFQDNLLALLYKTSIACTSKCEVDIIINRHDWKYKNVIGYSEKNSYKWRDLYEKAGCDSFMVNFFSTYLSQYVHGLFISNTKNPNLSVHYSLIYDIAISLEKRLILAIQKCFKMDNITSIMLNHIDFNKLHNMGIDRSCVISYFTEKQ